MVDAAPSAAALPALAEQAVGLLVDDEQIPSKVAAAVSTFGEHRDRERLDGVRVAVAQSRAWGIGAERWVRLVAKLVAEDRLTQSEAAQLLKSLPHAERTSLSPASAHLIQVADAVAEDEVDHVMRADDDPLFIQAVRDLLAA